MLDAQIMDILACPACKEPLEIASPESISKLTQHLNNCALPTIEAGLVCKKHNRLFVFRDGIPILLFNESISLDNLDPSQE
jgi:uncharacterized protein YbaR (Trm112 family)